MEIKINKGDLITIESTNSKSTLIVDILPDYLGRDIIYGSNVQTGEISQLKFFQKATSDNQQRIIEGL